MKVTGPKEITAQANGHEIMNAQKKTLKWPTKKLRGRQLQKLGLCRFILVKQLNNKRM